MTHMRDDAGSAAAMMPRCWGSNNYLVPSGDDELFLVQRIIPRGTGVLKL